jgi:hypothetical protein
LRPKSLQRRHGHEQRGTGRHPFNQVLQKISIVLLVLEYVEQGYEVCSVNPFVASQVRASSVLSAQEFSKGIDRFDERVGSTWPILRQELTEESSTGTNVNQGERGVLRQVAANDSPSQSLPEKSTGMINLTAQMRLERFSQGLPPNRPRKSRANARRQRTTPRSY